MARLSLYFIVASLVSMSLSSTFTNASVLPQSQHKDASIQLESRGSRTYSVNKLRSDLDKIMNWAGDSKKLNQSQKSETIAAIIDSAARFYPDLDQQIICRAILADIKAESDFEASNISGAREDSGRSYGLMQVSPEQNGAQELDFFKQHYQIGNSYSGLDSLKDYVNGAKTSEQLNVQSLTMDDLFRPWVNIHIAAWLQSNLGRTASKDPSDWSREPQLGGGNGNAGRRKRREIMLEERDRQLMVQAEVSFKKTVHPTSTPTTPDSPTQSSAPRPLSYPKSLRTSFGSWVAGPGKNEGDTTGYKKSGDDISSQYLNEIMKGVQVLYNDKSLNRSWLSKIVLKSGTIDYKS